MERFGIKYVSSQESLKTDKITEEGDSDAGRKDTDDKITLKIE